MFDQRTHRHTQMHAEMHAERRRARKFEKRECTLPTELHPLKVEMTGVEPATFVRFSAEGAPSAHDGDRFRDECVRGAACASSRSEIQIIRRVYHFTTPPKGWRESNPQDPDPTVNVCFPGKGTRGAANTPIK